jgi:hypothetical protein
MRLFSQGNTGTRTFLPHTQAGVTVWMEERRIGLLPLFLHSPRVEQAKVKD